jgi:hypothetical protein
VAVELEKVFGSAATATIGGIAADEDEDFATLSGAQFGRLQRLGTPWTIGHTPRWFRSSIEYLVGRFKDELWDKAFCSGRSASAMRSSRRC